MRAHHVNFRYILLEDGKEYFLLDKLPTLLGYFFPYLNWFSNRTLYRLTESQFWEIRNRKKSWSETFTISTPILIAIAVWAGRIRGPHELTNFLTNTQSSVLERYLFLFLIIVAIIFIARFCYYLSHLFLSRKFPFYNYKKEVGKVKLERTSQWSRKQFKIIILFLLLSVLHC